MTWLAAYLFRLVMPVLFVSSSLSVCLPLFLLPPPVICQIVNAASLFSVPVLVAAINFSDLSLQCEWRA
jgi:hypothetical protein